MILTIHEIPSPRCWRLSHPGARNDYAMEMQLTDHGPSQGTLTIRFDGRSWTNYWGAMGCPIIPFLASSHVDYVVTKLAPQLNHKIHDWPKVEKLVQEKLEARAADPTDKYDELTLDDDLRELRRMDEHDLQGEAGYYLIGKAFKHHDVDAWELPMIPNPEFLLMERLVTMCILACKELNK